MENLLTWSENMPTYAFFCDDTDIDDDDLRLYGYKYCSWEDVVNILKTIPADKIYYRYGNFKFGKQKKISRVEALEILWKSPVLFDALIENGNLYLIEYPEDTLFFDCSDGIFVETSSGNFPLAEWLKVCKPTFFTEKNIV